MRLPKQINVMGKNYQIIKSSDMEDMGLLDEEAGTLSINMNQSEEDLLNTLVHELGHALFRRCGFNQGVQDQLEESIVQSYANMITEVFNLKLKTKKKTEED